MAVVSGGKVGEKPQKVAHHFLSLPNFTSLPVSAGQQETT